MKEPGSFPEYHMSRSYWITAALDGSVPDDRIQMLLDISFRATKPGTKKMKEKGGFCHAG